MDFKTEVYLHSKEKTMATQQISQIVVRMHLVTTQTAEELQKKHV
jgi:hypothetical protein